MEAPRFYRRRLPHIQPEGAIFDICFRLEGSLPRSVIERLQEEREAKREELKQAFAPENRPSTVSPASWQAKYAAEKNNISDQYYHKFDDLLDDPTSGPTWLSQTEIAELVKGSIHFLEQEKCDWSVIAYCIMPNHIHLIVKDVQPVLHIALKSVKQFTAMRANRLLDRTGKFWHRESYDRVIRNDRELRNRILYTLNNPVKAGLVESWEDWPHTYCDEAYWPL